MCFDLLCSRDDVPVAMMCLFGAPSATRVVVAVSPTPDIVPTGPPLALIRVSIGPDCEKIEKGGRS